MLRLLAAGRSNTQIGEALCISPRTVQLHVTHLLAKLGLPTAPKRPRLRSVTELFESQPSLRLREHASIRA